MKLRTQKMIGIVLFLILSALAGLCAAWGEDATACVMLAPLALWLTATRKEVIL